MNLLNKLICLIKGHKWIMLDWHMAWKYCAEYYWKDFKCTHCGKTKEEVI